MKKKGGGTVYSKVLSLGLFGLDGYPVTVEADTSNGLPAFDVVGLPDAAVSESRERVRAAMRNSGFSFPVSRITVNLAPADKKKTGPIYDLPIFLSVLLASGQLSFESSRCAFVGELALDGKLREINGVLPMALAASECGIDTVFVPAANAAEAAVAKGLRVYGAKDVREVVAHLRGERELVPARALSFCDSPADYPFDFSDVKGQSAVRRAVEIAAAGSHNLLLIGPPGSGKSLIAKRIPSILPPLSYEEAVETTKIYSVAGALPSRETLMTARPFRSPHHTVSPAGLTGGGTVPKPGEISLSHNGVLFLDELPEFNRTAMEVLRQPIEDGVVTISRVSGSLTYPCSVMLVAAMNPCPCGNFGSTTRQCTCTGNAVERYLGRISGPLLDRLDLHIEVPAVDYDSLSGPADGESSADIRARVTAARELQSARYASRGFLCNAHIPPSFIDEACAMTSSAKTLVAKAFDTLGLSARAYSKVLKVARTIADLEGAALIDARHVAEAVQYRALDKKYWLRA